jgi:hypothetical protein
LLIEWNEEAIFLRKPRELLTVETARTNGDENRAEGVPFNRG